MTSVAEELGSFSVVMKGGQGEAILEPRLVGDLHGHFHIETYQRGYRWGEQEVGQLLDDIGGSGGAPYYLQPIVVKRMGENRWELIDGQQRLTTLFLILTYMWDAALQSTGPSFSLEYATRRLPTTKVFQSQH